ncbi:hypothetical protein BLA29_003406, partial [Euroglyphus maynei]
STPFQNKPERGRGRRHRYLIDRSVELGLAESLKRIFRTPKKGTNPVQSLFDDDDDDFHVGCWDEWFAKDPWSTRKKSSRIELEPDDWNLRKLFREPNSARKSKLKCNPKNNRMAKHKRRLRRQRKRIDFDTYDDWSLEKLYLNEPIIWTRPSNKSSDDNESIDSTCLDSGVGSFESHGLRESFSSTKEFWQQFCDGQMMKKSEITNKEWSNPPSPTIKSFKSLPEPLVQHENDEKNQVLVENRYGSLTNLKRAKMGECYEYLNEFELIMRKYFPELEQQEDVGPLFTLLMHGIPNELYWLNYWIRCNYGCSCDQNTISRYMIDFDQLKAIILNEEQAYLRRNKRLSSSNDGPQSQSSDKIAPIRSCPIPESSSATVKRNVNFQIQSLKLSDHSFHAQRRWSVSIDRHMELVQFYRRN